MKQLASAIADLVHIRDIESGLGIERFASGTFFQELELYQVSELYQELEQVFLTLSFRANDSFGFSFAR